MTEMMTRSELDEIINELRTAYPGGDKCGLRFGSAVQLLVSTILSAQCTDVRVNKVTPVLFARFPDAQALAEADPAELEALIRSCGLYHTKAANIKKCCAQLMERYGGEVPDSLDALTELAGTGRKTANLVMGEWFGEPAYVIDTHVKRIWALLGISAGTTPETIEKDLRELIPPEDPRAADALALSHLLITHGRAICVAGRPDCGNCPISAHCAHFKHLQEGSADV
ncbi:MAG: endonuclease III [Clostridia bacterium]|nr:endonuclease III [Clostridia bacterium]